jgi:hypothetical protein
VSQGTIGKKLSELAVQIAKMLPSDRYRLIFKLHPDELVLWRHDYKDLANTPEIEVIGREKNVYELFSCSDIQVGVYSTAIYEGLGFGLTTFIYKVGHYEDMECLVDAGYAQYIEKSDDLVNMIKSFDKDTIVNRNDRMGSFWIEDSQNNLINQINRIVDQYKEIKP